MTVPLPPSNPHALGPDRLLDHNKRIRRREGTVLPTPRTYRKQVLSAPVSTSGLALAGNISVVLQPGEIIGIMARGQVGNTSGASATVAIDVELPYGGPLPRRAVTGNFPFSSPSSGAVSSSDNADSTTGKPDFTWFGAELGHGTDVTAVDNYTLPLWFVRRLGTGVPTLNNLYVWVLVL